MRLEGKTESGDGSVKKNDIAGHGFESCARSPSSASRAVTCAFAFVAGLIALAFVPGPSARQANAQTGPDWITLLDGNNMGDWDRVGETNWRLEGGAV